METVSIKEVRIHKLRLTREDEALYPGFLGDSVLSTIRVNHL